MTRPAAALICAALLTACASHKRTDGNIQSVGDPEFIAWYKTATPLMRTTLFITLCAAKGFNKGSIEINMCISNMRRDARIRIEGSL